jgi:hypothetical protein
MYILLLQLKDIRLRRAATSEPRNLVLDLVFANNLKVSFLIKF